MNEVKEYVAAQSTMRREIFHAIDDAKEALS
jgi:hypothetical protein